MNSDTKRLFSKFDTRGGPDLYQHYTDGQLRNRLTNPSVVITVALLVVTVAYQAAHRQRRLPSILQLLWGATVTVIPARLLFALDRLINPPLFPLHMLKPQPPTRAAKSDALRRILGMDNGGGIIGSVSQVGRKGLGSISSAALGSRPAGDQPPGLGNYDNSCYQNSILQGLASLKHLPAYLSAISLERRLDLAPTRTVDTLRELMAELTNPSSNGRTLWTPKVLKNMSTWQQQDAQEYYSKLLDQIDNEIAKAARALKDSPGFEPDRASYDSSASQHSDDSGYHSLNGHSKLGLEPRLARNPLEGFMAQRVACVSCGHCEGLTMIPFNCLTLTLGSLPEHDLYERLDHYTKVESIEGVECLKCSLIMCRDLVKALAERTEMLPEFERRLELLEEALEEEAFDEETLTKKCNIPPKMRATSTKTKQVVLARPPQSLVFHVNRSGFDEQTGYMFKNSAAVRFPMVLDMGPWCLGSTEGRASLEDEGAVAARDVEQWTLDPRSSMVAGDREPSRITGPIYELRAVVTHYGHHENGHYVCYRKHPLSSPPTISKSEGAETPDELTSEEYAVDDGMDLDHETGPGDDGSSGGEADGAASSQDEPQPQWWRLSDEDVTRVDERTVLSQGGVFMLFYDCVDPNSVLVSDLDKSDGMERAAEDSDMQDEAPPSCLVIQSSSGVEQNGRSPTYSDSDSSTQLDDALPLPGTATTASEPSETRGLGETASQPQALSPEPQEPAKRPIPVIGTLDPAEDQNMGQASPDSMTQPMDGLLLPQSLARVPEV
ncbi:hypothetical protein C8A01DRAFT_33028 [Parachaetomium inaequale]|uniref:ubiquitinyl hydrolase 1 n=1 Tax=Parachaetomium inaequale TaxID=2588326 RepID=A0AAN6PKY9_9PEZI|nr:hypothetical protein C8A01DRAFT_33028 [Parachaetomium inaequale]